MSEFTTEIIAVDTFSSEMFATEEFNPVRFDV
jgi:hypothetical protein